MTQIPNAIIPADPMRNAVTPDRTPELRILLNRLKACIEPDNTLDMQIEMSLFEPDELYASVRPNAAFTKLLYTRQTGENQTCWAWDWTLIPAARANAAQRIVALISEEGR